MSDLCIESRPRVEDEAQALALQAPTQEKQARVSPISGVAPPAAYRFKPGQSGNPKGKPKKDATISAAEALLKKDALANAEALIRLRDTARDESVQVKVAIHLHEYNHGKVDAPVSVSVTSQPPAPDEIDAACAELGVAPRAFQLPSGDVDD